MQQLTHVPSFLSSLWTINLYEVSQYIIMSYVSRKETNIQDIFLIQETRVYLLLYPLIFYKHFNHKIFQFKNNIINKKHKTHLKMNTWFINFWSLEKVLKVLI